MSKSHILTTGTRASQLKPSIQQFLKDNPDLHLGGADDFHSERAHHLQTFAIHAIPADKHHPIYRVVFTAIRGPHGTIPLRVFYPTSGESARQSSTAAALIYFHGGGYTVGSIDEFENGLRLLVGSSSCEVYAVEYRLAPAWRYPTQLDEYSAVIDVLRDESGRERGVATVLDGGEAWFHEAVSDLYDVRACLFYYYFMV